MATSNAFGLFVLSPQEANNEALTTKEPSFQGDEADYEQPREDLLSFYQKGPAEKAEKAEKYQSFLNHARALEQAASALGSGKVGTPLAAPNKDFRYRFEALNPKHRMGDYLAGAYKEFEQKATKLASAPNFFDWVEERIQQEGATVVAQRWNPACASGSPKNISQNIEWFCKGVKYCKDQIAREHYEVKVNGGLLERQACSTRKVGTFDSEALCWHFKNRKQNVGECIWVLSTEGKFYTHASKLGRFHHSSFTGGDNVDAAGQWKVEKGKITEIDGVTGHYRVGPQALESAIRKLNEQRVFSEAAVVKLWKHDGTEDRVPVKEFVANSQAKLADRLLAKPDIANQAPPSTASAKPATARAVTAYSVPDT